MKNQCYWHSYERIKQKEIDEVASNKMQQQRRNMEKICPFIKHIIAVIIHHNRRIEDFF